MLPPPCPPSPLYLALTLSLSDYLSLSLWLSVSLSSGAILRRRQPVRVTPIPGGAHRRCRLLQRAVLPERGDRQYHAQGQAVQFVGAGHRRPCAPSCCSSIAAAATNPRTAATLARCIPSAGRRARSHYGSQSVSQSAQVVSQSAVPVSQSVRLSVCQLSRALIFEVGYSSPLHPRRQVHDQLRLSRPSFSPPPPACGPARRNFPNVSVQCVLPLNDQPSSSSAYPLLGSSTNNACIRTYAFGLAS
jgi:hypothetical protein